MGRHSLNRAPNIPPNRPQNQLLNALPSQSSGRLGGWYTSYSFHNGNSAERRVSSNSHVYRSPLSVQLSTPQANDHLPSAACHYRPSLRGTTPAPARYPATGSLPLAPPIRNPLSSSLTPLFQTQWAVSTARHHQHLTGAWLAAQPSAGLCSNAYRNTLHRTLDRFSRLYPRPGCTSYVELVPGIVHPHPYSWRNPGSFGLHLRC